MEYDPRLTPARPDLAASHLRGTIEARSYSEGRRERIVSGVVDMRGEPSPGASLVTQALRGETFVVYEIEEGWAWGQLENDSYVGYLPAASLAPTGPDATHRVNALSTFLYPGPSMKLPVQHALPMNALLSVGAIEGEFARVEDEGFVWAAHLSSLAEPEEDFAAIAEKFINAPYLWGGRTAQGIDCSGLVQTSLGAVCHPAPRDTDMQEAALGDCLIDGDAAARPPATWDLTLQRGDLVFWRGHVGIMLDPLTLLHANGHHMLVAAEPLVQAAARIHNNSFGPVTSVRRLNTAK